MQTITSSSDNIATKERKKFIPAATFLSFFLVGIFITPSFLISALLGGGLPYVLIALIPPLIFISYFKFPLISILLTSALFIFFTYSNISNILHGRRIELSLEILFLMLSLIFQIISLWSRKNRADIVSQV